MEYYLKFIEYKIVQIIKAVQADMQKETKITIVIDKYRALSVIGAFIGALIVYVGRVLKYLIKEIGVAVKN